MYRTLTNLEHVDRHRAHDGPFEVTQLVNSFLAAVAHPWDQLLDKEKLKGVRLDSRTFRECGFPNFVPLPVDRPAAPIADVHELLRVLRNGMSHGNMALLDRKELRRLRPTGTLPRVGESDIAGIRLWNSTSTEGPVTWCTVLDVHELRQVLSGMKLLCEKRSLWKDSVRGQHEANEARRKQQRIG